MSLSLNQEASTSSFLPCKPPSSSTHKGGVRRANFVKVHLWVGAWNKQVNELVAHSCPTFCNPMASILLGSSVHGILQASILEWAANPVYRRSSWPRGWPLISCTAGGLCTIWATGEAREVSSQSNLNTVLQSPLLLLTAPAFWSLCLPVINAFL